MNIQLEAGRKKSLYLWTNDGSCFPVPVKQVLGLLVTSF